MAIKEFLCVPLIHIEKGTRTKLLLLNEEFPLQEQLLLKQNIIIYLQSKYLEKHIRCVFYNILC